MLGFDDVVVVVIWVDFGFWWKCDWWCCFSGSVVVGLCGLEFLGFGFGYCFDLHGLLDVLLRFVSVFVRNACGLIDECVACM